MTLLYPLSNDEIDVPLGNGCYADFYRRGPGGSGPKVLGIHGHAGGFGGFDRRMIACTGGPLNRFAAHLRTSEASNVDVASIGTPQWLNNSPTNCPHLPPIVPTPTGFKYPVTFDLVAYAIQATIEAWCQLDPNNDPANVVLLGASARAHAMASLMYRQNLPVKALLALWATPDMRKNGSGVDIVHSAYWRTYFGVNTAEEAAAIPMQLRKEMSPVWWISRGQVAHHKPTLVVYERDVGDDEHSFGEPNNPLRPKSAVHDAAQLAVWKQWFLAANLPHKCYEIPGGRNAWETDEHAATTNAVAEQYLLEQI